MIKLNLQKAASADKKQYATLVVIVRKKDKKTEAIGADASVGELMSNAEADGVSFNDYKKGIFYRGVAGGNYRNCLVVGLDEKDVTPEGLRRLAGTVYGHLKQNKSKSAAVAFSGISRGLKVAEAAAGAFAEGLYLSAYEFKKFKTKKKDDKNSEPEVTVESLDLLIDSKTKPAKLEKAIADAAALCECVNFARDLGNHPGNTMTPEILAEETMKAAKGTGLKVTAWDKARIKKEGFGGLLGVSLGSAVDPRFIVMEYHGAAKSKKPVCFVGKGLTFDSGGISIKPSSGMEEMKFDMCGGANVIGTMPAIARLKLKVNAIGLVPSTENMPGPLANKPGDILVARNGKTVEVDNTDAEGRLILMDALAYASEQKPAAIFDAATLTGAIVVALGNSYTGVFSREEKVRKKISEASEKSGEWVWHMPLNEHHLSDMKGTYADLNNISSFKGAGSSTAAAFLEQFVDKDIPWAHFDIAGTAWHVGNRLNYCPKKGASGVMIRTFVELAKAYG